MFVVVAKGVAWRGILEVLVEVRGEYSCGVMEHAHGLLPFLPFSAAVLEPNL